MGESKRLLFNSGNYTKMSYKLGCCADIFLQLKKHQEMKSAKMSSHFL